MRANRRRRCLGSALAAAPPSSGSARVAVASPATLTVEETVSESVLSVLLVLWLSCGERASLAGGSTGARVAAHGFWSAVASATGAVSCTHAGLTPAAREVLLRWSFVDSAHLLLRGWVQKSAARAGHGQALDACAGVVRRPRAHLCVGNARSAACRTSAWPSAAGHSWYSASHCSYTSTRSSSQ